ncbi:MAG: ribosomal protein S18-alanine N-acetyltransferase [Gammaproteobacteria bacterium]|nr:ribosomal protein S18-alanine N-acetyltransferase [Gammaproteobacteria bacterium]
MATHSRNVVIRLTDGVMRITPISAEDLSVIYEIESRSMPFGWSSHIFKSCLVEPYECWKMEKQRRTKWDVIGYYVLYLLKSHAELCNLCVDVDEQQSGYGTQLLTHAIERCSEKGIETIALDVRQSNSIAQKLYTSFGFEKVGIRKSYYAAAIGREDAEIMELRIS